MPMPTDPPFVTVKLYEPVLLTSWRRSLVEFDESLEIVRVDEGVDVPIPTRPFQVIKSFPVVPLTSRVDVAMRDDIVDVDWTYNESKPAEPFTSKRLPGVVVPMPTLPIKYESEIESIFNLPDDMMSPPVIVKPLLDAKPPPATERPADDQVDVAVPR